MQRDNLELLRALEEEEAAARRKAVWTSSAVMLVAALVLAGLLFYGNRQLTRVRALTATETARLDTLRGRIDSLRPLVENYQSLVAAQTATRPSDSLPPDTSRVPRDSGATQVVRPPRDAPFEPLGLDTAPLVAGATEIVPPPPPQRTEQRIAPRVYLQVVAEEDRAYAEQVGRQLEARGFRVLGVEYVERAARLRNTELRYYKRADADDARDLLAALRDVGEESTALLYLGLESNTRVRPRHYEVWFPRGAGALAARRAGRPRGP